ncbi:helix-turn-helix domain-containing protein [Candidatus Solirubrobacter pratensis]|uniref:helix-turn-helix domain-containing protein n=1 Tax=Candidatus Solirubrobacter pratensis TaxID=1298857 RepID=UPI0018CB9179|nr:helix-turn-helix domain-containing protein [Candidatus Solirubrobacter pratensis]
MLDRIQAEIRVRLRESEAAVREHELLEAALTALDGIQVLEQIEPTPREPPAPSTRRRTSSRHSSGRAPRGANRAAVLRVLGDRPGVSVTELSSASGVTKPVLYNLLRTLEQRGEISREELPGGTTGYRLAPDT